jgi:maltooligosyltrehalose synthase
VLTGATHHTDTRLPVSDVLAAFPVAVLTLTPRS